MLVLLDRELDASEATVTGAPLARLLEEGRDRAIGALLPTVVGRLVTLQESLLHLMRATDTGEAVHLRRLVVTLGTLLPGVGIAFDVVAVAASVQVAKKDAGARLLVAAHETLALRRVVRELRTELGRLGERGSFLAAVG